MTLLGCRTTTEFDSASRDSIIKSAAEAVGIENSYPYLGMTLSSDWIILLHKDTSNTFVQYLLRRSSDGTMINLDRKVVVKKQELMTIAFDRESYHDDFISFESPFFQKGYELSVGGETYFVFYDHTGRMLGESELTLFVKPNPIDDKVYYYLANQLVESIKKYSGE